MRRRKKKGQMEIMGLAIVMVLVVLGFLFVVRLRQFQGTSIREEFTETQFASNLLNSILKTTSEGCFENDLTGLYQDCVSRPDPGGGYTGAIRCSDGRYSCEYINDTLFTIFNATLLDWNRRFEYIACEYDDRPGVEACVNIIHNYTNIGCRRLGRERKTIPIPTRFGIVMIRLDLC